MIVTDFWFCVAFLVAYITSLTSKKLDSVTFFVALACFYVSVIYSSSNHWEFDSDVANHVIFAIPFMIGILLVQNPVKKSLLCYAILQFVAAVECYLYETETWFYNSYIYLQCACTVYILFTLFRTKRRQRRRFNSSFDSGVLDLSGYKPYTRNRERW